MRKFDYVRNTPPGTNVDALRSFHRTAWAFFALLTLLALGILYLASITGLKQVVQFGQADAGTRMPSYLALLRRCLKPWFVVLPIAVAAAQIAANYRFYRVGSRADYTMRRLPDRWDYHRRCWIAPIYGLLGTILWCLLAALVMLAVYWIFTPRMFFPQVW